MTLLPSFQLRRRNGCNNSGNLYGLIGNLWCKHSSSASSKGLDGKGLELSTRDGSEAGANEWLIQLAEVSLADSRPSVPAEQVFRELRAKYGRPTGE